MTRTVQSTKVNRIIRQINLGIALLLCALAGLVYWYAVRPLPVTSGTLSLPVSKSATVVRDARGVPHIEAATLEDAWIVQGYTHAQDRLWQMDALRRLAAGELSEIIGPGALEIDQDARKLRMRRAAEEHLQRLTAEDRRMLAAYARGVNRFMETHRGKLPVEFTLLGYDPKPWRIADSILVGLHMFRSLTTTWKDEGLKQNLMTKGDAQKVNFLFPVASGNEVQLGSNGWAISGKHTASGKPILANDTHLEWAFPGPWYSVHVKTPQINVIGFSLPGLPAVVIGHNERIAWGITNLHFDVQDMYAERIDLNTGRYAYKNQLEQARLERETIRIKGRPPVELPIWVTRHGPIIQGNLALRWTATESGAFQLPMIEIGQAKNWNDFRKALTRFTGPGSNFVYADVDGNIGYQAAGKLPIRRNYNGDLPTEGVTGESEWDGYIPFEELPTAFNPESGFLITSNQNPFGEKYKYHVNGNFSSPYRSRQIEAILKSHEGWKPDEMLRIQTDVYSAFSQHLAKEVYRVWEKKGQQNPNLREAAAALKDWNGQMVPGTAAPMIVTLIFQQFRKAVADKASPGQGATYELQMAPVVLEKLLDQRPKDWFADYDQTLLECFAKAVDEGTKLQGSNAAKWDYGKYTEFVLPHPVLSKVPYVGRYFIIGPLPMAGASTTVKQTTRRLGPSMRFIADLSNWEGSLHNVTMGQSGQPFSAHFRDQWNSYISGRSFPMEFQKVNAKETLQINPLQ